MTVDFGRDSLMGTETEETVFVLHDTEIPARDSALVQMEYDQVLCSDAGTTERFLLSHGPQHKPDPRREGRRTRTPEERGKIQNTAWGERSE